MLSPRLTAVPGLLTALALTLTGCSAAESTEASPGGSESGATTDPTASVGATAFSVDGTAACDFLDGATVASGLGLDGAEVSLEDTRDKDDQKVCRYELRESGSFSVFILAIDVNDSADVNPTQYTDRLDQALTEGLPVPGFDLTQTFVPVEGLGTEAVYSGNLPEDKNLVLRLEDEFLIQLNYNKFADGADIGDYQAQLVGLAHELLG
ncbi:hypothetical protein [uncultured Schumannella sp.]|uniref:hypothetical protein n=1 Tax=uncultured Schumannella sp. TaxID=1195956 RepID=UPI0025D44887|nr:hypothetical protein [uncultured Schumannella sp.]